VTTITPHINPRGGSRRSGPGAGRLLAALAATLLVAAILPSTGLGYGWPVKPFAVQHPVRGSFGDPRTLFHLGPSFASLYHGGGSFSFHQGVDVCAPDGTAVYPVASGVVTAVTPEWIRVGSAAGDAFEYWHVNATVRVGQSVTAQRTVLGRVKRGAEHVHLTEIGHGRVVNPMLPGHLTPYADHTTPWVASIDFRASDAGPELMVGFLRGSVELLAEAYDLPTLPAPDTWKGLPVTPALLTWRIEQWNGKVVVPETIARDVRTSVPPESAFWSVYARGTYQNMSVFGKHYSWGQPGRYVFRLTPRPFDTRQLQDGLYQLVVTATDTGGNHSSLAQRFAVHNAPGVVGV
jgi:hypothetical protein